MKVSQKSFELLLPQIFYQTYLKKIQGIHFTKRQIDVIACLMAGKEAKKIASLLSTATEPILFKTVANHIHQVKLKIKVHGQNDIIDFIEKSTEYSLLKKYYSCLLIKSYFEKTLKEFAVLTNKVNLRCVIHLTLEDDKSLAALALKERFPLEHQLENHLRALGISTQIQLNTNKASQVNIQNDNISNNINKDKSQYLLSYFTSEGVEYYLNINTIEFESYYHIFFEIIHKIFPTTSFEEAILRFKKQYHSLLDPFFTEINFPVTSSENEAELPTHEIAASENNTTNSKNEKIIKENFLSFLRKYRVTSQKTISLTITSIFFIILCGSWFFNHHFKWLEGHSKTQVPLLVDERSSLLKEIESNTPVSWNLPRQDHLFIGRKELLNKLSTCLNPFSMNFSKNSSIVALSGLGGVGKTQLALQYAYHAKQAYRLKVWFSAANLELLHQKYLEFAEMIGYIEDKKTIEAAIFYVDHWLENHPGTLLIFDDVTCYEDIAPFLTDQKETTILITTRNQLWPKKIQVLPLDVMSEAESIQLVENITKTKSEHIKKLTEELGYLPLALAQASAYIAHNNISVEDYLNFYHKYQRDLLADPTLPQGTQHDSVAITWNVSLQAIENNSKNQDVRKLVRIFLTASSYFSSENIPVSVLHRWLKKAYPQLKKSELLIYELLSELQDYSLLRLNKREKTFSLHPLVQTVMKNQHKFSVSEHPHYPRLTPEWYESLAMAINEEFDLKTQVVLDGTRQKALLPHLQSLTENYKLLSENTKAVPSLGRVFFNIGNVFLRLGAYWSAKPYYEQALKIQEEHYGKNNLEVANTLTNLGEACKNLGGGKQAEIFLEGALSIFEQHYGKNHPNTVSTLANLGCAYGTLGKDEEARAILTRALNISEKDPRRDELLLAEVLLYLGDVYSSLGNAKLTKEYVERSLRIKERYYGKDHPELTLTMTILGSAYVYLKDPKPAIPLLERSLHIQMPYYGKDHRNLAITSLYLGKAYNDTGEYLKAKTSLESALSFFEKSSGQNYYLSLVLTNLGTVYANLNQSDKAKDLFQKALAIEDSFFKKSHPETAITLLQLAKLHSKLKEFKTALPLAEKAYQILIETYGRDHYHSEEALKLITVCNDMDKKYAKD